MLRKMIRSRQGVLAACSAIVILGAVAFVIGVVSGDGGADAAGGATPESPTYTPSEPEGGTDLIGSAKMIGPSDAWASTSSKLAITEDSGGQWTNITPQGVNAEWIRAVYFEDVDRGWIAVSPNPYAIHPKLSIFATSDGGQNWQVSKIHDPRFLTLSGVELSFVGKKGWMLVEEQSPGGSNAISWLYTSSDEGASWKPVAKRPPVPGELKFNSVSEGWLAGGVGEQSLWHTADGGMSWTQVTLELPSGVREREVSYVAPEVSKEGSLLLPTTFSKPDFDTEVGIYTSSNQGLKWQLEVTVPIAGATEPGLPVKATFPNPETVALVNPESSSLSVVDTSASGPSPEVTAVAPAEAIDTKGLPGASTLSLFDDGGVALVNDASCSECSSTGQLFFTSDGGKSWKPSVSRP